MDFEKFKSRMLGLDERLLEDEIYRFVWEEIESDQLDRSAQARAMEEGAGDEGKTRSAYIKHRVRRLKDELELHRRSLEQQNKQTTTAKKSDAPSPSHNCSFCGAPLGWLTRSAQLCTSCQRKINKTRVRL